uniref:Uncharacterized protein n=1 Tax=viral metagenome TaxID=1070528 RepID=A0A6M3LB84_9ZZZZ
MLNQSDIITEFLVRNSVNTSVGFYTDTILNNWSNQAHKWAAGYKKWPFTEGRASTTFASLVAHREDGYLVGEYPEGWKSDSIRMMRIGGYKVGKREFYKFTQFLEDYPSDSSRIFSDYMRVYYVNPNIDVSGTVTLWGQYTPLPLDWTVAAEPTVFAGEEEGNEAIVEMMMSYALKREKKLTESLAHAKEAQRILDEIWERIKAEQYNYQVPPDDGMFERFDVLEGGFEGTDINQF